MIIIHNKFIPFKGYKLMNILGLVFSRVPENRISMTDKRHEQIHTYQQWEIVELASVLSLILCTIFTSLWYLIAIPIIPFVVYIIGWLCEIALPPYHNAKKLWKEHKFASWVTKIWHDAYLDNCFEREAYANESNVDYLETRIPFAWIGYILKKSSRRN
jgi:hypothetical protein